MNYAAILTFLLDFLSQHPHLWQDVLDFWNAIHTKSLAAGHAPADQAQHDQMAAAVAAAKAKVAAKP